MSERRGSERHGGALSVRLEATGLDNGHSEADIVNVSAGGACLRKVQNLDVGHEVSVQIPTEDGSFAVRARVIWVNLDGFHGLQFLNTDDEIRQKLVAVAARVKESH